MAAIFEPQLLPHLDQTVRTDLRLVPGASVRRPAMAGSGAAGPVPDRTVSPMMALFAVIAVIASMALAVAIGRGGLADLAPPPASASVSASPSSPASGPGLAANGSAAVVVETGDTIWSIARRLQPEGDVRPLVDRLVAANGSTVIVPGQRIVLGV